MKAKTKAKSNQKLVERKAGTFRNEIEMEKDKKEVKISDTKKKM